MEATFNGGKLYLLQELNDLDAKLDHKQLLQIAEKLTSFYELAKELKTCKTTSHILAILMAETRTKNRQSYIRRIYGYYHKVLPGFHAEEVRLWARKSK